MCYSERVCERLCEWVCVIARECVKGCAVPIHPAPQPASCAFQRAHSGRWQSHHFADRLHRGGEGADAFEFVAAGAAGVTAADRPNRRLKLVGEPHDGRLAVDKLVADDSGARRQTGMRNGLVARNERPDGSAGGCALLAGAQSATATDVASRICSADHFLRNSGSCRLQVCLTKCNNFTKLRPI